MSAETMNPSTDDFASMFEASFAGSNMQEGRVVPATVISVENDAVIVDVGLKTEGRVPLREFGQDGAPNAGDIVEVYLERIENALGEAVLSRDKARREEAWTRLEKLLTLFFSSLTPGSLFLLHLEQTSWYSHS